MFSATIGVLRKTVRMLLSNSAPGQLASGVAIGMMIGLVPKGNLIALSLCVLLFSLRCNKGIGLVVAIAVSFVGPMTDQFTHRLGLMVLGAPSLQTAYASIFNLPLGPWSGLDNTVVVGSLALGAYLAYPVFWITRLLFSVFSRRRLEAAA
jgi:uncharacterized protein (TIGR03546 family)